jgi:hypothetical protein
MDYSLDDLEIISAVLQSHPEVALTINALGWLHPRTDYPLQASEDLQRIAEGETDSPPPESVAWFAASVPPYYFPITGVQDLASKYIYLQRASNTLVPPSVLSGMPPTRAADSSELPVTRPLDSFVPPGSIRP